MGKKPCNFCNKQANKTTHNGLPFVQNLTSCVTLGKGFSLSSHQLIHL